MEKAKDIKDRIRSITGTRKITKAMEIIASSKIREARNRIVETRPFINEVEDFITDVIYCSTEIDDPLMKSHERDKVILVIGITADRGLCGGYNSNIFGLIERTIKKFSDEGKEVKLDIIGTRGKNHFRYMGLKLSRVYENLSEHPRFLDAREISREIIERYVSGEVDRVIICYTKFKNMTEQVASIEQILPISIIEKMSGEEKREYGIGRIQIGDKICKIIPEFMYDPSPEGILSSMLPEYIYTLVYGVLLESTASEIGARMTAMKSASDNADDIIKNLTTKYHRTRQRQITIEISEIVSGVEALKKEE